MNIPVGWQGVLSDETKTDYYIELLQFIEKEYTQQTIYPKKEAIFNALELTPFEQVKVVLLGQDPYHGPNQAHGLSFSVENDEKIPPSLRNMYKEMVDDLQCEMPVHGNLTHWAAQGVLLLNTVLTVRAGQANSHQGKGWEQFTDAIICALADREEPVIFVLWGKPAQAKERLLEKYPQHIILQAPHPSPLSAYRGFFGSKPYSQINRQLQQLNVEPIDWHLT